MAASNPNTSRIAIRWARLAFSVVIAMLLWFTIKLVENYTTVIEIPIAYRNIPSKLKFKQELPPTLLVTLSGKGHELLFPSLNLLSDSLEIDLSSHIGERHITSSGLVADIRRMLPEAVALILVKPDTLRLDFEEKIYKTVPLVATINIKSVSGYRLAQPVRLDPDSVVLTGSAKDLASVSSWTTEPLTFDNLTQSATRKVKVQNTPDIFPFPKEVEAEIIIKRYVEGVVEVPVRVENSPLDLPFTILPQVVKVYYAQPFDDERKVAPSDFEVIVDFQKLYFKSPHAKPEVIRAPLNIKGIRVEPSVLYYKLPIK